MAHDFPPDVRAELYALTGGRCDHCGTYLPPGGWHAHHRQKRRHGRHDVANCSIQCTVGHDWVHGHEGDAQVLGWTVPSWLDPSSVPIMVGDVALDPATRQPIEDLTGWTLPTRPFGRD